VIVLERDNPPAQATPRAGVPQGKHVHGLLAGGQQALEALFPGFVDDLAAAGAVRFNSGLESRLEQPGYDPFPQRDLGLTTYAMSRPLLEHVVRLHALQHANVTLHANCTAREIIATADGAAVKAVYCARGDGNSETLAADLVVDASGRGAPALAFLEAHGHPVPTESTIGVDIRYATALFAIPKNAPDDWKVVLVLPDPRVNTHGAIMFPIEGGHWLVTLAAAHGDAPPADADGFLAFAQQLRTPTVYNAIRGAESVGTIARFAFPGSVRRHFNRLPTFPRGLIPVADAVCRFNPTFGQGMSVAAMEACLLRQLLRELATQSDPLAQLAPAFFSEIETMIDTPWAVATNDFIFPQTRGERPPDFEASIKFQIALNRLAARDPSIHKVVVEVRHLIKPRGVLREPAIAQRVLAEMGSL
jgi:2-polyprenyl-6-methoxyphenol hydroxylase-like FAD-dependent oxidoreductase